MNRLPSTPVYQVADLRIDTGRRLVIRDDTELALPKLSFDLLLTLIERAPNVVSLDEFADRVWSGLVVSPETIAQRAKLLRDALGDDPRKPRYIAAVRGLGYRLIAPVSTVAGESATPTVLAPIAEAPSQAAAIEAGSPPPGLLKPRRSHLIALLCSGVALLAIAGAILWQHRAATKSVLVIGAPINMVAVLPFDNLSADRGDDFIALGLSEMVLNRLAGVSTLRVVARTSSFALAGQRTDAQDAGRKLQTRYLVEGSVQHVGALLRVTARVVDAASGRQFSAMHVDKPMTQIFDIQDEIADGIAAALSVRAGDVRKFHPEQARNANIAAYLEYLQGRVCMGHWKVSDEEAAIAHFRRALEIDPQFAAAYSSLAVAQDRAAVGRRQRDAVEIQQASSLIATALSLDDGLGEAYLARANLNADSDAAAAEADYRKGLSLSPSDGTGYSDFAEALYAWGRTVEANDMLQRAMAVDPLSPRPLYATYLFVTGSVSGMTADEERQAEHILNSVLELDPTFTNALVRLSELKAVYFGAFADAAALGERALRADPQAAWIREDLLLYYLGSGDPIAAQQVIGNDAWYGQLCLAAYRGDWRQAAELEFHRPAHLRDVDYDYLPILAIQWFGHQTHQYDGAIAFLKDTYRLQADHEFDGNFDAAMSVAILTREKGDQSGSRRLATQALAYLDQHPGQPGSSMSSPRLNQAKAHLLLGQTDAALDEMKQSSSEFGGRIPYGWTFAADPLWDPVRSDPRFQAIATEYRAQTVQQHVLLVALRTKGDVPSRN
jgi:TolB-like protein/DNA-binding winged helix-turn-helix (wHTH) protein/Tfp pilus assembly protein PilF